MRPILFACALALAACGDNANPHSDGSVGNIDATSGHPDSNPGAPDASPPDAGPDAGPTLCTGLAYDSCTDTVNSTDCLNGVTCRAFPGNGFTVCSPDCDTNTPCPNSEDGTTVACPGNGHCKPDAANACALP